MIDAKELRIGNLVKSVYAPYGHPQDSKMEVVDIHILERINNYKKSDNFIYEPIPITPEILEKYGIVKIIEGTMSHPEVYRKKYKRRLVENNFDIQYRGSDDIYWLEGDTLVELYSLHELQNLYFSLTGEELTVNLK